MEKDVWREDAALVRRFLASGGEDTAAFTEIVRRYERQVFRTLRGIVPDEFAVEDLAQEVFLEAFRNLPSLREPEKLGAWLTGIARRMALRFVTRRRTVSDIDEPGETMALRSPEEEEPEFSFLARERKAEIWTAVMSLPEKMRQAAVMFYYHDLSVAEIARSLSLPRGTVTRRLFDARAKLKERLTVNEKKNSKEKAADGGVPAGFAEEVERRIGELSAYYARNGRVRDEKFEEMFGETEKYIETLPDAAEQEKKSALAMLYVDWGQSKEKIAEGYALAEESGNGAVLVWKMVDELFAISDYGQWLSRIDEEMLPKMEALGSDKGKGVLLFWRARAMAAKNFSMQEIQAVFEEAARLLPKDDVMQAAAVCGCRTAAFALENAEDPCEDLRVISARLCLEGGKLAILSEPGFSENTERMWRFRKFSSLDYYASCQGKLFFDLSLKPGESRSWEKDGGSFLVVSYEEEVTVPAGHFDHCMHTSYREEGFSSEVWYAKEVGLVRAVFPAERDCESYELVEYEKKGGEGYFPLAEGNRWLYQNPNLPEELTSFFELFVTWTDGKNANLSAASSVTPKKGGGFTDSSEILVDRCSNLCDEEKIEEALEALRLALRKNTSESGTQAALGGIDHLTRFLEYAKKGYRLCPSSFGQFFLREKSGKVTKEDDSIDSYCFGPSRYGTRHAENRIFGVKFDRYLDAFLGCVWDDKWVPGYRLEEKEKKTPCEEGETHPFSFAVSEGGSVTVPAGRFDDCLKLTLEFGSGGEVPLGRFQGNSQWLGRKEYYFAKGVGLVKFDCDWGKSLQSSCELVSYRNPAHAEGYYPLAIGCAWEYDETHLTAEGYRAKRTVRIPCGRGGDFIVHTTQEFLFLGTEEEYEAFKVRIGEGKKEGS